MQLQYKKKVCIYLCKPGSLWFACVCMYITLFLKQQMFEFGGQDEHILMHLMSLTLLSLKETQQLC